MAGGGNNNIGAPNPNNPYLHVARYEDFNFPEDNYQKWRKQQLNQNDLSERCQIVAFAVFSAITVLTATTGTLYLYKHLFH